MAGLFAKLTAIFDAPEAAPKAGQAPTAVAMAALMIQLARADGHYDEGERAGIKAALDARFGDGEALLAAGEAAEENALDSHQFTKLVKTPTSRKSAAICWRIFGRSSWPMAPVTPTKTP